MSRNINDKPRRVVVKIDANQAPYVESKPFHNSQVVEQRYADGSIVVSLKVVLNNELNRLLLGYGHHVEILEPLQLRMHIAESILKAADYYKDSQS